MKTYFSLVIVISLIIISCKTTTDTEKEPIKKQTEYDISMYPKSNDSIKRFIIDLPVEKEEGLYSLEIWAGQTKKVDCNQHSIPGKFTKKTVEGWGYSYYEFTTTGQPISTRMACPDTTLTEKFIRSIAERIRYNSKLPVVVYCPSDFDIEYAIWTKNGTSTKAKIK